MIMPSLEEIQAALESPVTPPSDKERIMDEERASDMGGHTEILMKILENTSTIKYLLEQSRAPQAPSLGAISQQLDSF